MGGIDFLTILIVILSMLMGYYRGIIGSIGDLLGIVLGLIISTFTYRGPVKLFQQFDITGIIAELVVFVFTSLFFIVLLVVLFEALKKRIDVKHVVDRIIGIFAGVL